MSAPSPCKSEEPWENSKTLMVGRGMTNKAIKYNSKKLINNIYGNECEISSSRVFPSWTSSLLNEMTFYQKRSIQFECQMNGIAEKLKNEHESCLRLKAEEIHEMKIHYEKLLTLKENEIQNLKATLAKCNERNLVAIINDVMENSLL